MPNPARLLIVILLVSLSSCGLAPGSEEPSPPAAISAMGADGGGLERVTAAAGDDLQPAWSPDGRRLAFVRRAAVPAAEPSWWRTTTAAVLGVLAMRLAVGAVVVGVVVWALKGRPLSALAGVLAAAAGWVMFTQAPTSRQAQQVGGLVLGIVLFGGLAALLVGAMRPARPGSRWMRLIQRVAASRCVMGPPGRGPAAHSQCGGRIKVRWWAQGLYADVDHHRGSQKGLLSRFGVPPDSSSAPRFDGALLWSGMMILSSRSP
jgi:WD40-like Beta Propeller Repeat